ncbi:DUF1499 domain-containing protein [Solidesulfovibrio sp.]
MMGMPPALVRFFVSAGEIAAVALLVAVVVGVAAFAWLGAVSRKLPPSVSPPGGPLRADGSKPNWVSSTARKNDGLHFIAPRACPENPLPALEAALRQNGLTVVQASGRYLHATAKSSRFGFVDDLEFLYDPAAGLLHARSASRVGHSDLGVNRRRLEQLFTDAGL